MCITCYYNRKIHIHSMHENTSTCPEVTRPFFVGSLFLYNICQCTHICQHKVADIELFFLEKRAKTNDSRYSLQRVAAIIRFSFANQLRNGFPVIKIACIRSWVFSIPQRLRNASRSRSSTCCSVIGVTGEQSPPVRTRARWRPTTASCSLTLPVNNKPSICCSSTRRAPGPGKIIIVG